MSKHNNHIPKYCHHRGSGQACVTLDGQTIYLGAFGSAASREKYDRTVGEWIAAGRRLPADPQAVTIAEVVVAFRQFAKTYYGPGSKAAVNIDEALRPVLKLYGRTAAVEFGPLRLKAVREAMIADGRVRQNINRLVTRIRGVFKWAAENELIPASVFHGLMAVKGLQAGRSGAIEGQPVKPVPVEYVEAVIPLVSPQVAAMIRIQLLTGMRPGEATIMRGCDLDTTGTLWIYRPAHHKTQHHGHDRAIYLGPKAQDIIRPFLKTDLLAHLFSPADAEVQRRAILHEQRKTPMSCGNCPGDKKQEKPKRLPGDHYTAGSYLVAVYRGCDKAFPPPADMTDGTDKLKWRREHRWHVHQLRHTAATELRKEHGIEAAQVILGHRTLSSSQIYAEKNVEVAKRVMAAIG
jgi:integrase